MGSLGKSDMSIARCSQTGHSTSTLYTGVPVKGGGLYLFNVFADFALTLCAGI